MSQHTIRSASLVSGTDLKKEQLKRNHERDLTVFKKEIQSTDHYIPLDSAVIKSVRNIFDIL